MKHVIVCALEALFALACQNPAERVISAYSSEPKCLDRLQYTIQPDVDRDAFQREYASTTCKTGKPKTDTSGCDGAKVGDTCLVTIGSDTGCLQRASESEFKIDWQCSSGYNEIPVKTYKANPEEHPLVLLRLHVELSDYYNYAYSDKKSSHQSLRMSDRRSERLEGYVERASEAGKRLASLLADGKTHDLILAVTNLSPSRSSDMVEVLDLVQEDWRTLAPSTLEVTKKRAGDRLWSLNEAARIAARDRFLREFDAGLR